MAIHPQTDGPPSIGLPGQGAGRRSNSNAWMVTFTDLVALLLTFFVMVFAMRDVEENTWQTITNSFVTALNTMEKEEVASPRFDIDIKRIFVAEGEDLDYLQAVIESVVSGEELPVPTTLELLPNGVAIRSEPSVLLSGDGAELSNDGRDLLFHLSGILGNLPNALEIVVDVPGEGLQAADNEGWAEALRAGGLVAAGLAESGLAAPVTIRARWAEARNASDAKLDIVILPQARN